MELFCPYCKEELISRYNIKRIECQHSACRVKFNYQYQVIRDMRRYFQNPIMAAKNVGMLEKRTAYVEC